MKKREWHTWPPTRMLRMFHSLTDTFTIFFGAYRMTVSLVIPILILHIYRGSHPKSSKEISQGTCPIRCRPRRVQ